MYKYVLNSVVKISVIFAKYFEYYTIILGGGGVFRGHAVYKLHYVCGQRALRLWTTLAARQRRLRRR